MVPPCSGDPFGAAGRPVDRRRMTGQRPAVLCRELLAALEASEGRRRRRKRDTTPDSVGLHIKRELLERAIADDPAPEDFEGWLLDRSLAADGGAAVGAVRAMALELLHEWRLAEASPEFHAWLERGAPSDDAGGSDRDGR